MARQSAAVVTQEDVASVLQTQGDAIAALLASQAENTAQKRQSHLEHMAIRDWCAKTPLERTQELANEKYAGAPYKFAVSIPKDKAQLKLTIPANSPEEARGRYDALCGIRSCDHEYAVAPVG